MIGMIEACNCARNDSASFEELLGAILAYDRTRFQGRENGTIYFDLYRTYFAAVALNRSKFPNQRDSRHPATNVALVKLGSGAVIEGEAIAGLWKHIRSLQVSPHFTLNEKAVFIGFRRKGLHTSIEVGDIAPVRRCLVCQSVKPAFACRAMHEHISTEHELLSES